MKLSESQLEKSTLAEFGHRAAALLSKGDFDALASQFGYALALQRDPAKAIAEDLSSILCGRSAPGETESSQVSVKYFEPNDTHLLAVVECLVPMAAGVQILLELVAARNGEAIHLFLEDLRTAA